MPESRRRKRAPSNADLRGAAPRGLVAHVVRLVGDQQRRRLLAAPAVELRAGRERLVGHRHAVAVARLGAGGVRPVGLEVEAVAGGVGRPLARDVGRRRDDADARDAALGEHPVRHVEPERRLARRGRRGGEERALAMGEHGRDGLLLPRSQGAAGGPRGERADRHERRRKLAAAPVGTSSAETFRFARMPRSAWPSSAQKSCQVPASRSKVLASTSPAASSSKLWTSAPRMSLRSCGSSA